LAWFGLLGFRCDETGERADWDVGALTDHNMIQLAGLNEPANFPLGKIEPGRELLWCFYALVGHYSAPSINFSILARSNALTVTGNSAVKQLWADASTDRTSCGNSASRHFTIRH
jgi:hypothetical protein